MGIYADRSARVILDNVTIVNALIEDAYIEGTDDVRITGCRLKTIFIRRIRAGADMRYKP